MDDIKEQSPQAIREVYLSRSEYNPREGLEISLVTTETHESTVFPGLTQVAKELLSDGSEFTLAIIEGSQRGAEDAQVIGGQVNAKENIDLFIDPLSPEAFRMFRTLDDFKAMSTAETASRYVGGWLAYMQRHGHPARAMDREFTRVLGAYFPKKDYLPHITPYLNRLRRELGEEGYTEEMISCFQKLVGVVNEKSAHQIAEALSGRTGRVFVYCGKNHKKAVEKAVEILQGEKEAG